MIKTLAVTLFLATTATAAVAAIPGRNSDVDTMMQILNTAAKADRLDAPTKADRLPFTGGQKLDASLIVTGPARIATR